jgi:hypothetical protein
LLKVCVAGDGSAAKLGERLGESLKDAVLEELHKLCLEWITFAKLDTVTVASPTVKNGATPLKLSAVLEQLARSAKGQAVAPHSVRAAQGSGKTRATGGAALSMADVVRSGGFRPS